MTVKARKENCRLMKGTIFQLRDLMHPVERLPEGGDEDVITRDTYRDKYTRKTHYIIY